MNVTIEDDGQPKKVDLTDPKQFQAAIESIKTEAREQSFQKALDGAMERARNIAEESDFMPSAPRSSPNMNEPDAKKRLLEYSKMHLQELAGVLAVVDSKKGNAEFINRLAIRDRRLLWA
jgi:hypothetical protein